MRDEIRVSMGTLRVLGMELLSTDADPTTAYLQTFHPGKCLANCRFCAQARMSSAREEKIARGLYPPRDTFEVLGRLSKAYEHGLLRRACIQTMNYSGMFDDLVFLVEEIRKASEIPISVSVYPLPKKRFCELREAGADNLVVPLDAATPELFDAIKGGSAGCPYSWENHLSALKEAVSVFGRGNVGTHLIIGFGESGEDAVGLIQRLSELGVYSALFAFTSIEEAQMQGSSPPVGHYRRIQLARYLVANGLSTFGKMGFEDGRITDFGVSPEELEKTVASGLPFMTSGCPDCNRPYSTENPGGVIYNYPKPPLEDEISSIKKQLRE